MRKIIDTMKKSIILTFVIFILILPISAKPEGFVMGPYKVTFDIGKASNLTVKDPVKTETFDGAYSVTNYQAEGYADHTLIIAIGSFEKDAYFPFKKNVANQLSGCNQVSVVEREIDGHDGILGSGFNPDPELKEFEYDAGWWMDNKTAISLFSTYPWDEGTLSLLRTIHVDKITSNPGGS